MTQADTENADADDFGRAVPRARRHALIAEALVARGSIAVIDVQRRFNVSPMTARRDLAALEDRGLALRTHGGAVARETALPESPSPGRPPVTASIAHERLAARADATIASGEAIWLDASTTSQLIARRLIRRRASVALLTNSPRVAEDVIAASVPTIGLTMIGGTLSDSRRGFVGPDAVACVERHFADRLFLGVAGVAGSVLTEVDALEAEVKRAMLSRAHSAVVLLDSDSAGSRGNAAIAGVASVDRILCCGIDAVGVGELRAAGGRAEPVS
jgi:DeoR/GlpR family transcriptional regulator of sugar metabolism